MILSAFPKIDLYGRVSSILNELHQNFWVSKLKGPWWIAGTLELYFVGISLLDILRSCQHSWSWSMACMPLSSLDYQEV